MRILDPFRQKGWQKGVVLGTVAAFIILLLNAGFLAWIAASTKFTTVNATIFSGNCSTMSRLELVLHLLINIFSTALLAASNYCMQVLSAPTRAEIDLAHVKRKWLDIGVLSARNLFFIDKGRVILWLFLGFLSMPLHLLYNSVIYSTMLDYEYNYIVVTPDFLDGAPFSATEGERLWGLAPTQQDIQVMFNDISSFENLTNAECIAAYSPTFLNGRSDVILMSNHTEADDRVGNPPYYVWPPNSVWAKGHGSTIEVGTSTFQQPGQFICTNITDCNTADNINVPSPDNFFYQAGVGDRAKISYCLSKPMPNTCTLQASLPLLAIVIGANFGKIICMVFVFRTCRQAPLVTIGDAISSFLEFPDQTTLHRSLQGRADIETWNRRELPEKTFQTTQRLWMSSVSAARWSVSLLGCITALGVVAYLLAMAITTFTGATPSLAALVGLGFGNSNTHTTWQTSPPDLYSNIMIANTPQFIFSMLYVTYNALFTGMLLAEEWNSFATKPKPLRVTSPRGEQLSTPWLQLPYIYGIPLMVFSALLHWIISQSFFLLDVNFKSNVGAEIGNVVTCGYSIFAMILGLGVGVLMLLAVIATGLRTRKTGMPVVGSCSAAISAACHPILPNNDALRLLQWGDIRGEPGSGEDVKRCAFSSGIINRPVEGGVYA